MKVCWATMESVEVPGHTHLCEMEHTTGDHYCTECQRWFFTS